MKKSTITTLCCAAALAIGVGLHYATAIRLIVFFGITTIINGLH